MTLNFIRVIKERRARNRQIARDAEILENLMRIAEVLIKAHPDYNPQKESA